MKNSVQDGKIINYTVPSATTIAPGSVVIIGGLVGVAQTGGTTGDVITVCLTGVFTLPKATGAIAQGAVVYWSTANSNVTTTASDNTVIGNAFEAALSAAPTVDVRLDN